MPCSKELGELAERRRRAALLGGKDRVERHHTRGKLTVRERIGGLLDEDSFAAIGSTAGFTTHSADGSLETFVPANIVIGDGTIDRREVVVAGDDSQFEADQPKRPSGKRSSMPSDLPVAIGCQL